MTEVAARTGASLVNFERSGSQTVLHNGRRYTMARPVLEFKFILNLPKLKTHVFTGLTGAVKNLFGSVPGLRKAALHQEAPHPAAFARRMLDVYEIARPTFHLADGVMVLDTKGPSSGRARPLGCLVASADGVALDAVFARMAGCTVKNYLTGREARERGYAGVELKNVDVAGLDPKVLAPPDFRVPGIALYRFIPSFLGPLSERLIRAWPVSTRACTGCGFCADSCPADAIEVISGKAVMDPGKCILCLCCHEVCPEEAVEVERSFLARRLFP
jgi:ferredoxin